MNWAVPFLVIYGPALLVCVVLVLASISRD